MVEINTLIIYLSSYIGLFAITFYFLSYLNKKEPELKEIPDKELPTVSIIIPAWNEEKGIAGTIQSAINLDYPKNKLEIIVIDDGSKDNTYAIAKEFEKKSRQVRVYKNETNMGKGNTMNIAIKKSKSEIIVTMDADNIIVKGDILKKMVANFTDENIMCVAPTTAIYNPKGILQRIQQVEYLLGTFLRKAFSSMNAIHITSGAFSVYRKSFFDKYGLFDTNAITEDMEMALRIQYYNYKIANDLRAIAFTIGPNRFIPLMKQRRRWYTGLIKALWKYKELFSKKYGPMGLIVLPVALITVAISVLLTSMMVIRIFLNIGKEIQLLQSINFNIASIQINRFLIERIIFTIITSPVVYFFVVFILILTAYMLFAKRYVKEYTNVRLSMIYFILFYSFIFAFWWLVSIFYVIFNKKVLWR